MRVEPAFAGSRAVARVRLGPVADPAAADRLLAKAVALGYTDAFLVPAGQGRCHAGELLSSALATKRGERWDCGWCRDSGAGSLGLRFVTACPGLRDAAKAAIILDSRTGVVLFEKDADERMPPASMSKLMTAYMIFDQLKGGRLKLDDEVLVSERAWKMGGSQMFVEGRRPGEGRGPDPRHHHPVRQRRLRDDGGGDRGLGGRVRQADDREGQGDRADQQHVRQRHRAGRARTISCRVRDLALLARRIITDFPEYFKYYSEREFEYGGIRQPNRNPLLQAGVPGVDGMKTGFTDGSGYGLVATAKRDDRRVITVMAGLQSAGQRRTEGERLLEYGFREFQEYRLFAPGAPWPRSTCGRASLPRCRWS